MLLVKENRISDSGGQSTVMVCQEMKQKINKSPPPFYSSKLRSITSRIVMLRSLILSASIARILVPVRLEQ